jgi:hypothetical protein
MRRTFPTIAPPKREVTRSTALRYVFGALLFLVGLAYIYRPFLAHGLISGDIYDAYIQIAILQNWSNCFSGLGHCFSPAYFYPLDGVLGYNDGYLISGTLFHVFRLLGIDALLSYELVYVTVRLIGYLAVIALGVRYLKLPTWAAIAAAWLSLVSINLLNQVEHTQFIYGALLPVALLLLVAALDRIVRLDVAPDAGSGWQAAGLILILGALCAAWSITAFYSLFYFLYFTLLLVAAYAALRWQQFKRMVRHVLARPGLGAAVVATAAMTPSALWSVYAVALKETGGHPWQIWMLPHLYDLLNVGPYDLVWSPVIAPIYRALSKSPMAGGELATGFPVFFAIGLIASGCYLVRMARRAAAPADSVRDDHLGIAMVLGLSAALSVLMVVRVGGGYSAWRVVWEIVPGASAIRSPSRFLLFPTSLFCLVMSYAACRAYRDAVAKRLALGTLVVVFAALTVEQYQTQSYFTVDPKAELAFFDRVPAPPGRCRSFYVSRPRREPTGIGVIDRYYVHASDAMMIAAFHNIPTVNGMATFVPKDSDLDGPFASDYKDRVARYATRHHITDGLCSLDLKTFRWEAAGL